MSVVSQCRHAYVCEKLIKIYYVVQELCAFLITANGRPHRQTDSHSDHSGPLQVLKSERLYYLNHFKYHMRTNKHDKETDQLPIFVVWSSILHRLAPKPVWQSYLSKQTELSVQQHRLYIT